MPARKLSIILQCRVRRKIAAVGSHSIAKVVVGRLTGSFGIGNDIGQAGADDKDGSGVLGKIRGIFN